MTDILSPKFWSNEERIIWEQLAPFMINLLMAGAKSGSEALPSGINVLIDWDVFNNDAQRYLNTYKLDWVRGINESTRNSAVQAISNWIESGEPLPILEKRLIPLFSSERAKRIAITEVTRAYADGNQLAWKASSVVSEKRWMTANDERVCPLCGPLHNKTVELSDVFIQTPSDITGEDASQQATQRARGLLRSNGAWVGGPPRHPNCRCWLQPIVSEELFVRDLENILNDSD